MIYILIVEKSIYHEGDERSRTHPGHGYPAWTETIQEAKVYTDYQKFYDDICYYTKSKDKFRAFQGTELSVTSEVKVHVQ